MFIGTRDEMVEAGGEDGAEQSDFLRRFSIIVILRISFLCG